MAKAVYCKDFTIVAESTGTRLLHSPEWLWVVYFKGHQKMQSFVYKADAKRYISKQVRITNYLVENNLVERAKRGESIAIPKHIIEGKR